MNSNPEQKFGANLNPNPEQYLSEPEREPESMKSDSKPDYSKPKTSKESKNIDLKMNKPKVTYKMNRSK